MSRLWDVRRAHASTGQRRQNAAMIHKFKRRKFHLLVLPQGNFVHVIILAKSLQEAAHKHIHLVKPHT
jgi:hypothetical protein